MENQNFVDAMYLVELSGDFIGGDLAKWPFNPMFVWKMEDNKLMTILNII